MEAETCIFKSNAPGLQLNFYEPFVDMPSLEIKLWQKRKIVNSPSWNIYWSNPERLANRASLPLEFYETEPTLQSGSSAGSSTNWLAVLSVLAVPVGRASVLLRRVPLCSGLTPSWTFAIYSGSVMQSLVPYGQVSPTPSAFRAKHSNLTFSLPLTVFIIKMCSKHT